MKPTNLLLSVVLILFVSFTIKAPGGWDSAEKRAKMQTEYLKNKLSLNSGQVKTVKKANLEAEQKKNQYVDDKLASLSQKERSGMSDEINSKKKAIEADRDKKIKGVLNDKQKSQYSSVKDEMLEKTKQKLEQGDPQGGLELMY